MGRIFGWIGAGVALWILFYAAFWLRQSGCWAGFTPECNVAPIRAFSELVMLGWVEKYQTLVAGLLAIVAAFIASRPVLRQLAEMRKQSAASLLPIARAAAQELDNDVATFRNARDQVRSVRWLLRQYDEEDDHHIYVSWPAASYEMQQSLEAISVYLTDRATEVGQQRDAMRREGAGALSALSNAMSGLQQALRFRTSGPDYEEGENDLSAEETSGRRIAASAAFDECERWLVAFSSHLESERAEAWERIRQLERGAGAFD